MLGIDVEVEFVNFSFFERELIGGLQSGAADVNNVEARLASLVPLDQFSA